MLQFENDCIDDLYEMLNTFTKYYDEHMMKLASAVLIVLKRHLKSIIASNDNQENLRQLKLLKRLVTMIKKKRKTAPQILLSFGNLFQQLIRIHMKLPGTGMFSDK